MNICKYLAYASVIYTIACIYYIVRTRDIGTPFNDSLSPEQKQIKENSAALRKNIFMQGLLFSSIVLFVSGYRC